MEEKTTQAPGAEGHRPGGCFFCGVAMPMLERCWSEATRDHFRNSRIEFLKGLRSIIDSRIAYLSRDQQKGTRVTVE